MKPCFKKDCLAYSEQVGVYIQLDGSNGLMNRW